MDDKTDVVRELALMLIYLTSWQEEPFQARRSWKGFRFEILNELEQKELITSGRRSKSLSLTEEGVEEALRLLAKYGIDIDLQQ